MIVLDTMFNALFTILIYFVINHDHQDTVTSDWQQKEKFRGVSKMTELSWLPQKLLFWKERENFWSKKMLAALMSLSACEVGVNKNKKLPKTLSSSLSKTPQYFLQRFFFPFPLLTIITEAALIKLWHDPEKYYNSHYKCWSSHWIGNCVRELAHQI